MQIPFEMSWTNTSSEFQESFDGFWGDVSKGDELPYIPDNLITLNLGLNIEKFSSNISLKKPPKMRTVAGSGRLLKSNSTDELTIIDVGLRYSFDDSITFSFNINNFLNDNSIAARRPYGVRPSMPRSVNIGINYIF